MGGSFSADGRYILYSIYSDKTVWDLAYIDLKGDGKPVAFLTMRGDQLWPRLSPDGRYLLYSSSEGGSLEIYVKRFPAGEGKWQVSTAGGEWARWNRKGDRIDYVQHETLTEVEVATGPELRLGAPRALFTRKPLGYGLLFGWTPGFALSPAGDRFVIAEPSVESSSTNFIVVVENWSREFARPQ